MKTLTTLALTAALSGAGFAVQAGEPAGNDLAGCAKELRAYFGEDIEVNLIDRRRNQHGTKLRVGARLDQDNSYFATCWVARNDISEFEAADGGPMVAAAD